MKIFLRTVGAFALAALSITAYAADGSSLKPPPGARVAIVMFEDLECPTCASDYPLFWQTADAHHIPVLLHDFPLGPKHPWSFDAAVYARFFDTKSEKLGNDFRAYIFRNQTQINKTNLRQYVDKFANDNKTPLPFVLDPDNKLRDKVIADRDLGLKIGVIHTPTIFVVGNGGPATPAVEVTDTNKLTEIVEDMLAKAAPVKATPAKSPSAKAKKKARPTAQ